MEEERTEKKMRITRIRPLAVILSVLVCCAIAAGCGAKKDQAASGSAQGQEAAAQEQKEASGAEKEKDLSAMPQAVISVENYGDIVVALDADAAPATVENFIGLAKSGFYDGLTFHRIMDGFMIQGGDPNGNGTGGSDQTIAGEFASNGFDNPISHVKGVISMARSSDPDSASSQFFITVADSTFLDGEYAAFGYVTEGMEVADKIAKDAKPVDNNGTIPPEAQPVITSITIRE